MYESVSRCTTFDLSQSNQIAPFEITSAVFKFP
jgi:hypothetical protein